MSDQFLDAMADDLAQKSVELREYSKTLGAPPIITPPTEAPARPDFTGNRKAEYFSNVRSPRSACCVAAKSGDSRDADIWLDGKAPVDGDSVEIAPGVDVVWDRNDVAVDAISVFGKLTLAGQVNLDTLMGLPGSEIDFSQGPSLVFKADTDIDLAVDPYLRTRGFISMGDVTGGSRTRCLARPIISDVAPGDTTLRLGPAMLRGDIDSVDFQTGRFNSKAFGWANGDIVHLGADLEDWSRTSHRSEFVTITEIEELENGHALVRFNPPAKFTHRQDRYPDRIARALQDMPPTHANWFGFPVATNYSRPTTFKTADIDAPAHRRARIHVYNKNFGLKEFACIAMGRTDLRNDRSNRALPPPIFEADIKAATDNVYHRDVITVETGDYDFASRVKIDGFAIWSGHEGPVNARPGAASYGLGVNNYRCAAEVTRGASCNTIGAAYASTTGEELGIVHENCLSDIWGFNIAGDDGLFKSGLPQGGGAIMSARAVLLFENVIQGQEAASGTGTRFSGWIDASVDDDELPARQLPTDRYAFDPFEFLEADYADTGMIHSFMMGDYVRVSKGGVGAHKGGGQDDSSPLMSVIGRTICHGVEDAIVIEYSKRYALPGVTAVSPYDTKHTKGIDIGDFVSGVTLINATLIGYETPILVRHTQPHRDVINDPLLSDFHLINCRAFNNDLSAQAIGNEILNIADDAGNRIKITRPISDFMLQDIPDVIDERFAYDEDIKIVSVNYDARIPDAKLDITFEDKIGVFDGADGQEHNKPGDRRFTVPQNWQLQRRVVRERRVYRDTASGVLFTTHLWSPANRLGDTLHLMEVPFVFSEHTTRQIRNDMPGFGEEGTIIDVSLDEYVENAKRFFGTIRLRDLRAMKTPTMIETGSSK